MKECGGVGVVVGAEAQAHAAGLDCCNNLDAGVLVKVPGGCGADGAGERDPLERGRESAVFMPAGKTQARLVSEQCVFRGDFRQGVAVEGRGGEVQLLNCSASYNHMQGVAVVQGGFVEVGGGELCENNHANAAVFDCGSVLRLSDAKVSFNRQTPWTLNVCEDINTL